MNESLGGKPELLRRGDSAILGFVPALKEHRMSILVRMGTIMIARMVYLYLNLSGFRNV